MEILQLLQILDDKNLQRRFRVSNYQSTTKVKPFCTTMPLGKFWGKFLNFTMNIVLCNFCVYHLQGLSEGWNQIQFNLADFTRRAYGTNYVETVRVSVHANVRIRRIFFSDR